MLFHLLDSRGGNGVGIHRNVDACQGRLVVIKGSNVSQRIFSFFLSFVSSPSAFSSSLQLSLPNHPTAPLLKTSMKLTALVSLAVAVLAFSEATPIDRRPRPSPRGQSVPLTRNPHFKHNTKAQMAKLNKRYPDLRLLAASSGHVPLVDVGNDLEYYGSVSVGTPAQVVKLDFDTVSTKIPCIMGDVCDQL
jgi:hypothetical protein